MKVTVYDSQKSQTGLVYGETAINSIIEGINKGTFVFASNDSDIRSVCGTVRDARIEDGKIVAEFELMEQMPMGKLVKQLMDATPMAFSISGMGKVKDGIVQNYQFKSVVVAPDN